MSWLCFAQLAAIAQIGDQNETRLLQDGQRDSVYVIQRGSANQARMNQVFELEDDVVDDNLAFIYQDGNDNVVKEWQDGAGVYQLGNTNIATINQVGVGHLASAYQVGNANTATIHQSGTNYSALIMQNGNNNSATIIQGIR